MYPKGFLSQFSKIYHPIGHPPSNSVLTHRPAVSIGHVDHSLIRNSMPMSIVITDGANHGDTICTLFNPISFHSIMANVRN